MKYERMCSDCVAVLPNVPHYRHNIVSELPWNESLDEFIKTSNGRIFARDTPTGCVAARSLFDMTTACRLNKWYRHDPNHRERAEDIRRLRHLCRILPTTEDEKELGIHGRRVRGEIFFARRWFLVEGVTEYLLVHTLGKALGWPLDTHGVAVIDFKQSGNAGIYPALAEAFDIPWHMSADGDQEAEDSKGK